MLSSSASHGSSLLVTIAILAVAVVLLILVWRAFIAAIVLAFATFAIWHLDFFVANARRFGDEYLPVPVNQIHVAHFGLGLVCGLITFSTLFFVRAFAQAALVAGSVAITFILITEGVSGLMEHATALLQFIREFDFFVKGLIAGKFCAGLMKWKQVRQRDRASTPISR